MDKINNFILKSRMMGTLDVNICEKGVFTAFVNELYDELVHTVEERLWVNKLGNRGFILEDNRVAVGMGREIIVIGKLKRRTFKNLLELLANYRTKSRLEGQEVTEEELRNAKEFH